MSFHGFCSQFEEKFEEMNADAPLPSEIIPPGAAVGDSGDTGDLAPMESGVATELPEMLDNRDPFYSDLGSPHQDMGGIMRIVPSDVNVSTNTVDDCYSIYLWFGSGRHHCLGVAWYHVLSHCFCGLQADADYWLLSDVGVGITDMWRSDRILKPVYITPLSCD